MHVYNTTQCRYHHRAWKDGRVYTHILVAEHKLNRELEDGEIVHHIDKNKLNNKPENLMVFKTENDHKAFHAGAEAHQLPNGSWYCDKRMFTCKHCGKEFELKSGRKIRKNMFCSTGCAYAYRSKIKVSMNTIVEDIYELNGNFSAVGRKYGVSPNAIVNLCRSHGLKYHSRDYKRKKNRKK